VPRPSMSFLGFMPLSCPRLPRALPVSCRLLLALALALGLAAIGPPLRPARAAPADPRAAVALVVTTAHTLLGAPYAYIGDDPNTGFSCIGFVHYLYAQVGIDVPYDLGGAYAEGPRVAASDLRPGDLVFFSNTVWRGLSHVALYVGDGAIIGADNYATGVESTRLSDPYWAAHYTGATRPLTAFGATSPLSGTTRLPHVMPRVSPAPPPTYAPPRISVGDDIGGHVSGPVYSGPGYTYARIDRLAPFVSLRVVAVRHGWANVVYSTPGTDYYGWVDAPYLARCSITSSTLLPAARRTPPTRVGIQVGAQALVTASILYLRTGPSTRKRVMNILSYGQRVAVLDRRGPWVRIRAGNATGWVFARWLKPLTK